MTFDSLGARKQASIAALAGSIFVYATVPSVASCSTSGSTISCQGDVSGVDLDVTDITDVTIFNLSQDAGSMRFSQTAADGAGRTNEVGDNGSDATTLDLSFNGGSSHGAVNAGGDVLTIDLLGGAGYSGEGGKKTAGAGGNGGSGGGATVTLENTRVFQGDNTLSVEVAGGDGGDGGETSVTGRDSTGGDGGDGGDSGDITIQASGNGIESMQATDGALIYLSAQGGDAGSAGKARVTQGGENAQGGDGGTGGAGGTVSLILSFSDGATFEVDTAIGVGLSAPIWAESIGGAGGAGGNAGGEGGSSGGINGGDGGGGGTGGSVTVNLTNVTVTTATDRAIGLLARSLGAAGGKRGEKENGSGSDGANGGDLNAGTGGAASVEYDGTITTAGTESVGILVQSIGGFDTSVGVSTTAYSAGDQGGGNAGTADLTLDANANVTTAGDGADGLIVQSIGGGGGWANTSDSVTTLGSDSSAGGDADKPTLTLNNGVEIETQGDSAIAVLVQSIGAGGGSVQSGDGVTNVGAPGGTGGSGNVVTATIKASSITTQGDASDGIVMQSIGGGGGRAATTTTLSADFSQTVGSSDGAVADAAEVTLHNSSSSVVDINTSGDRSRGLVMQSVGGGGGDASNILSIGSAVSVDLGVGQAPGGASGHSDDVTASGIYSTIETSGHFAHGILAQSIGGGGGSSGAIIDYTTATTASVGVTLGGLANNTSNTAEEVDITVQEQITTKGFNAHGVLAQSIGGGGGEASVLLSGETPTSASFSTSIGGDNGQGGPSGEVSVTVADTVISTSGTGAAGILAQSIGGGGGYAGWSSGLGDIPSVDFTMEIGGRGGAKGATAEVSITNDGQIETTAEHAMGILAQSIGGGGGAGGIGFGDTLTGVTVGGLGSGGDPGALVQIQGTGSVTTGGKGAIGIFAQSIGGGGGAAGDIAFALGSDFDAANFGVGVLGGSDAGTGGDGGEVQITSRLITTTGESAHGIWAQSIGGGGGAVGFSGGGSATTLVGSAGDAGDGGAVTVTTEDTLSVSGDYSAAIFAQSVGGSSGNGGDVTININADVSSSGNEGWGVVAQSDGGTAAGNVAVNIADGVSLSTTGTSANEPITILGADTLTVSNYGTLSGNSGDAQLVKSSASTNTINNYGTITGNLSLSDSATNMFNNMSGGLFEPGSSVDLGDSGQLDNAGTISFGGQDNIISTTFKGLTTTTSGTFLFDVRMGGPQTTSDSDYLTFDTRTTQQTPSGTVEVNLTGTNLKLSGDADSIGLMYAGGPSNISIDNLTVSDGAVIDYTLSVESGGEVVLGYAVDYSAVESLLSANQQTIHDYIQELIASRIDELESSATTTTTALAMPSGASAASVAPAAAASGSSFAYIESIATSVLGAASASELQALYDRLAPGDVFVAADAALFASYRFNEMLNGCEASKPSGRAAHSWDGTCAWMQMGGTSHNRDRSTNSIDYDENAFAIAAGIRSEIATDWMLGFALGFENISQSNTTFNSDGYRIQTGVTLTRMFGATELSGSISGGYSQYDFTRYAYHASGGAMATAKPHLAWGSGHMRLAHAFALNDRVTVKPSFSTGVTHIRQDAFSETGAGDYQLHIGTIENTLFSFNPSVDVSAPFQLGGMAATATFHAGFLAFAGDVTSSTTAQFAVGGPQFTLIDEAERYFANIGASIETKINDRFTFEAGVDALFSSDVQNYGGGVGLKMKF